MKYFVRTYGSKTKINIQRKSQKLYTKTNQEIKPVNIGNNIFHMFVSHFYFKIKFDVRMLINLFKLHFNITLTYKIVFYPKFSQCSLRPKTKTNMYR